MKGYKARTAYAALTAALVFSAAGCSGAEQASGDQAGSPSNALVIQTVPETIAPLGLNGQILPALTDVDLPDTEPAPEYLRLGVRHEIIKRLQERLMELGLSLIHILRKREGLRQKL